MLRYTLRRVYCIRVCDVNKVELSLSRPLCSCPRLLSNYLRVQARSVRIRDLHSQAAQDSTNPRRYEEHVQNIRSRYGRQAGMVDTPWHFAAACRKWRRRGFRSFKQGRERDRPRAGYQCTCRGRRCSGIAGREIKCRGPPVYPRRWTIVSILG